MDLVQQTQDSRIRFVLPEILRKKAKERGLVLNKRYGFDKNGHLEVKASDASKLQRILCRYYQCTMESVNANSSESPEETTTVTNGAKPDTSTKKDSDSGSKQPTSSGNK